MNKNFLHQQLNGEKASGCFDGNMMAIKDPTTLIDCTAEGNYENFKHVVNGDSLVYAEPIQSTPLDGYKIAKGFEPPPKNGFVYEDDGLKRMMKSMDGMDIIRYDEHGEYDDKLIGKVYDVWLLPQVHAGRTYHVLCMLAWIKCGFMENCDWRRMCYRIFTFNHTCCTCGAKAPYYFSPNACSHMKNGVRIAHIDQIDACGGLYISQHSKNSILPRENANMCSLKYI